MGIFLPWPTCRTCITIARFRSGHIDFCNIQNKNVFLTKLNICYVIYILEKFEIKGLKQIRTYNILYLLIKEID